jgi:hypothetical protein
MKARISSAHVLALIAIVLAVGGNAFAFTLGKNSVGAKQLKKNSVTAKKIKKNAVTGAKIKKNAVTTAKIKDSAVNGAKVADGSLTGSDVNAGSMPFSQVVFKARGSSSLAVTPTNQVYPLDHPTYTQAASEDDSFVSGVDVTFEPTCTGGRIAQAFLLLDAANPLTPTVADIVGSGIVQDNTGGTVSKRIELGPFGGSSNRFEPGSPKQHTLTLVVTGVCGGGSGITATFGGVDVIGTTS